LVDWIRRRRRRRRKEAVGVEKGKGVKKREIVLLLLPVRFTVYQPLSVSPS
jgi:hypothetical protein